MTFGLAVLTVVATAVGGDNVRTAAAEVEEVTQLGGGEGGDRHADADTGGVCGCGDGGGDGSGDGG